MPLVIIKSPPGSREATEAIHRAAEIPADIVLMGDAVGLTLKDMLTGFCGTAFALAGEVRTFVASGGGRAELEKGVRLLSQEELEQMLSEQETQGPF